MNEGGQPDARSVVVTGANQGIGAAMARAFSAEGGKLFLMDLRTEGLETLAEELRASGTEVSHRQVDVTDGEQVEAAMSAAADAAGAVDVLVNCAGVFHAAPILEYRLEDWNRVMSVNVTGTLLCCQSALRRMIPAGGGRIVNLSSIAGRRGAKYVTAYCASKHAVLGITRCLALETAEHGITVNAICPGYVNTEMYEGVLSEVGGHYGVSDPEQFRSIMLKGAPIGRMVEPEEIAQVAVYLASPAAAAMTGQGITLDGGLVMQ